MIGRRRREREARERDVRALEALFDELVAEVTGEPLDDLWQTVAAEYVSDMILLRERTSGPGLSRYVERVRRHVEAIERTFELGAKVGDLRALREGAVIR